MWWCKPIIMLSLDQAEQKYKRYKKNNHSDPALTSLTLPKKAEEKKFISLLEHKKFVLASDDLISIRFAVKLFTDLPSANSMS